MEYRRDSALIFLFLRYLSSNQFPGELNFFFGLEAVSDYHSLSPGWFPSEAYTCGFHVFVPFPLILGLWLWGIRNSYLSFLGGGIGDCQELGFPVRSWVFLRFLFNAKCSSWPDLIMYLNMLLEIFFFL